MFDRSFPLQTLPAFEAAARHGSFKAAASELHLTASAISHQIKQLEGALGVALFRRLPRGLELTAAGSRYAVAVAEMLARVAEEGDSVAGRGPRTQIRFSMPGFVMLEEVLPHLPAFQQAHPDIELSITTGFGVADLEGGEADAAIRMGRGNWRGTVGYKLADCYGFMVASPELRTRVPELSAAGTLPVVCLSTLKQHTRGMLEAAGLRADPQRMLWVDSYVGVVAAARRGLGVAVVYAPTAGELPSCSGLVPLTEGSTRASFGMYLVCRESEAARPEFIAAWAWAESHFGRRAWLLS